MYVRHTIHHVVSFADSTQRYRNVYFHKRWYHYTLLSAFHTTHVNKETKNTWARDDPAILILMAGGMFGEILRAPDSVFFFSAPHIHVAAALAWSVVWSYGLYDAMRLVFLMVSRDLLLVGVVSATLLW